MRIFQFASTSYTFLAPIRRSARENRSNRVKNPPKSRCRGGASGSRFIQRSPPQRSRRTGNSPKSSFRKSTRSSVCGAPTSPPSVEYVQAWYRHATDFRVVPDSLSTIRVPRCLQTLWNALASPSFPRTTRTLSVPRDRVKKPPCSGICSSRPTHSQSRAKMRWNSLWRTAGSEYAEPGSVVAARCSSSASYVVFGRARGRIMFGERHEVRQNVFGQPKTSPGSAHRGRPPPSSIPAAMAEPLLLGSVVLRRALLPLHESYMGFVGDKPDASDAGQEEESYAEGGQGRRESDPHSLPEKQYRSHRRNNRVATRDRGHEGCRPCLVCDIQCIGTDDAGHDGHESEPEPESIGGRGIRARKLPDEEVQGRDGQVGRSVEQEQVSLSHRSDAHFRKEPPRSPCQESEKAQDDRRAGGPLRPLPLVRQEDDTQDREHDPQTLEVCELFVQDEEAQEDRDDRIRGRDRSHEADGPPSHPFVEAQVSEDARGPRGEGQRDDCGVQSNGIPRENQAKDSKRGTLRERGSKEQKAGTVSVRRGFRRERAEAPDGSAQERPREPFGRHGAANGGSDMRLTASPTRARIPTAAPGSAPAIRRSLRGPSVDREREFLLADRVGPPSGPPLRTSRSASALRATEMS